MIERYPMPDWRGYWNSFNIILIPCEIVCAFTLEQEGRAPGVRIETILKKLNVGWKNVARLENLNQGFHRDPLYNKEMVTTYGFWINYEVLSDNLLFPGGLEISAIILSLCIVTFGVRFRIESHFGLWSNDSSIGLIEVDFGRVFEVNACVWAVLLKRTLDNTDASLQNTGCLFGYILRMFAGSGMRRSFVNYERRTFSVRS